jgi:hypothetical protein
MTMSKITNFYVTGECSDHGWITRNQDVFETELFAEMLSKGCIPVLDVPVVYKWEYDTENNVCKFKATAKCLKVGRKRAKDVEGIILEEGIVVVSGAKEVRELASI